ncbi:hypothetical protein F5148DRAFT_1288604 [Russula earlei]|uniref:Uncharacterized protein n=1 Tax=Russula earlei TaxID=71964 RepID=A0ACC0U0Q0_9AGAM|nr:hypothetical protein F5148DRAFT_1288604 [Russula earlei]
MSLAIAPDLDPPTMNSDDPAHHGGVQGVPTQSGLRHPSLPNQAVTSTRKSSPRLEAKFTDGSEKSVLINGHSTTDCEDRTRISVESWLEDANVVMLLSGVLMAVVASFLLQICIDVHPSLQRPRVFFLSLTGIYELLPRLIRTTSALPLPAMCTGPSAVPQSALTRSLWSASLGAGLGCFVLAALLKRRVRQHLPTTRPWHRPQTCMGINVYTPDAASLKGFFHALHASHLFSVFLFLCGICTHVLRPSNPPSLVLVVGSSATLFAGQCLILFAFPRDTRRVIGATTPC